MGVLVNKQIIFFSYSTVIVQTYPLNVLSTNFLQCLFIKKVSDNLVQILYFLLYIR